MAETIVEPCVALDAAELIESPCSPNTPLLFEVRRPVEPSPPTAPVERVAAPRVPPAFTGAEPAVFTTVPAAAPATMPAAVAARSEGRGDEPERKNANECETDDLLHDHCPLVAERSS